MLKWNFEEKRNLSPETPTEVLKPGIAAAVPWPICSRILAASCVSDGQSKRAQSLPSTEKWILDFAELVGESGSHKQGFSRILK